MAGWTKLYSSIPESTIWCAEYPTRIVWITFLAKADAEGVVEGSEPGFARIANVTIPEMRAAIVALSSPDPDSRTPDHEGRRIEAIPGGWRILNYKAYRERGQSKDGSRAPYYREYRRRQSGSPKPGNADVAQHESQHSNVARNTEGEAEAEEEAEERGRGSTAPATTELENLYCDLLKLKTGSRPMVLSASERESLAHLQTTYGVEDVDTALRGFFASADDDPYVKRSGYSLSLLVKQFSNFRAKWVMKAPPFDSNHCKYVRQHKTTCKSWKECNQKDARGEDV